jgi:hypothetical protein
MVFGAATSVFLWGTISFVVALAGCAITYFVQDSRTAIQFFESYVFGFNGVLVVAFGYGAFMFVRRHGNLVLNAIMNMEILPDDVALSVARHHGHAMSFAKQNQIALPIFFVGGAVLWTAGYPLHGFAKYLLAITSTSLYYVGGLLFAYAIFTMKAFREIDQYLPQNSEAGKISRVELDALGTYFSTATTLGVIAFYLAFRGTLTANFTFSAEHPELLKKMLVIPVIFFPWVPIFFGLYPRVIIKRLTEGVLVFRIEAIENRLSSLFEQKMPIKDLVDVEKSLLEIKQSYVAERSKLSAVSVKDSPSFLAASLGAIHFIWQNDSVVKSFFSSL